MSDRRPTGTRIPERRQERGLRQAELAASIGISPSYLNLIEHGRRRIAGKLLAGIARALDLDPAHLTDAPDAARLQALRAAALDQAEPVRPAPELARAQELLDRFPGWAALLTAQDRRIRGLEDRVAELAARLHHDHDLARALHQVISGVTAIRSAAGILTESPDLDRDWQGQFLRNIRDDSEVLADASRALARVLEAPGSGTAGESPREAAESWPDARGWHLPEAEAGRPPADLPEGAAGEILAAWAARYAQDAAALPLEPFAEAATEEDHDPARLAHRFRMPLPQVLRRLACLPAGHPPMGLVLSDASGTITVLKAIEGFPPCARAAVLSGRSTRPGPRRAVASAPRPACPVRAPRASCAMPWPRRPRSPTGMPLLGWRPPCSSAPRRQAPSRPTASSAPPAACALAAPAPLGASHRSSGDAEPASGGPPILG